MKTNAWILIIGTFTFLLACNAFSKKERVETEENISPVPEETRLLVPIEAGEVFYKNKKPFGDVINLTGEQVTGDTIIFKPSEVELQVQGDIVVIKNLRSEKMFMQFSSPDLSFIRYGDGLRGEGPDEFRYPQIVPTPDSSLLCYLFESTNQKLYKYHPTGKITPYPYPFSTSSQQMYSDKSIVNIAPDDFLYVETSPTGKSIYRSSLSDDDSVTVKEVFNLGLNPKRKSWAYYIGDFVVNPKQNRMAYAYKYFKIIKFMDLEAQTVKVVNFEREEFDEGTLYKIDGMDQNVTHYWGACAGDEYVYFLYSGRTPYEVARENSKDNCYIFVEQYDWNGNPVHTYKLDRWGYFTVDEKNQCIYLVSTNDDDPLFIFRLPE